MKPVEVYPAEGARPARAFIYCDEPQDMGRIKVMLPALEQWRFRAEILAGVVAQLLGFTEPPRTDSTGKRWVLGFLAGQENKGSLTLLIEGGATLSLAGHNIPLAHVLTLNDSGLSADKDALLRIVDEDMREPTSGIGSKAWRKHKAQMAASARHDKPGGSRDMQERMRTAWASGKYTSRDRCAEEECAALGISFATARRALRNTPDPTHA